MDKEHKKQLINLLEEGAENSLADEDTKLFTVLKDAGYLVAGRPLGADRPIQFLYTSIAGRKYLERLKAPRKAWLKKNWFAVSIAAITAFIGLASVIVQIVGLTLS